MAKRHEVGFAERRPPICYSNAQARFAPLDGAWQRSKGTPLYWNLSCPLEMSKYSCVHQGAVAHARVADLSFEPVGCVLPTHVGHYPSVGSASQLAGRRVIFMGDSLLKQLFIAYCCLLPTRLMQQLRLPWQPCGAPAKHWSSPAAHFPCGPHSSFATAAVEMMDGGSLHYVDLLRQLRPPRPSLQSSNTRLATKQRSCSFYLF